VLKQRSSLIIVSVDSKETAEFTRSVLARNGVEDATKPLADGRKVVQKACNVPPEPQGVPIFSTPRIRGSVLGSAEHASSGINTSTTAIYK
jgi:hypothetical protein